MADRNEGYGDDPEYVEYIPCEEMIKYEMPLNFNLETGEELSLSDLFEEGFDYITPINNWIFSTVFESNHVIMDGYIANPESEYDAKSVFAGINPNQKFIVCEDEIILCFGYETPDMCFDEYSSWCQYNFTGRRVEISNHIKQGINGEICTNVSHFNDIYLTKEYDYDVECINSIIYTGEHGDGLLRVKNHSWANKDGKTIGAAITYPKEMKGLTEDSFFKYIENRICKEFGSKYGKYDVHVMHEFEYIGGYRSMEVAFFPMDEQAYESNTESFLYKDNVICTFDEFIIDKNKYRESFIKDIYKNLCDHGDTNDIEYEEIGKIYDCMRPYFDGVSMTYSNNIIPTFSISEDELISIIESKLGSDYSYKCELVMGRMGINTESISNTRMGGDVEIGRIL